jgi:hypothetical protein
MGRSGVARGNLTAGCKFQRAKREQATPRGIGVTCCALRVAGRGQGGSGNPLDSSTQLNLGLVVWGRQPMCVYRARTLTSWELVVRGKKKQENRSTRKKKGPKKKRCLTTHPQSHTHLGLPSGLPSVLARLLARSSARRPCAAHGLDPPRLKLSRAQLGPAID